MCFATVQPLEIFYLHFVKKCAFRKSEIQFSCFHVYYCPTTKNRPKVKMDENCDQNAQKKISEYFTKVNPLDESDFMYCCDIEKCNKRINGKKWSNLTAHVKRIHKYFYEHNIAEPINKEDPIQLVRLKFIQDCAEIVAVSGRPFRCLSDPGFLGIADEKIKKLKAAGFANGLSAPNYSSVKSHIRDLADRLLDQIKSEVRNTFVSVMVDGATKYRRSILGVSIQYILNGCMVLRCVGMINLTSAHTSLHLVDKIMERLNLLGIDNSRIISITTDNAPNMLAMADVMNSAQFGNEVIEDDEGDEGSANAVDSYMYRFFISESEDEAEEDDECERLKLLDDILNDEEVIRKKLAELKERFNLKTMNVRGVRCGVHILQLGVKAALKDSKAIETINLARTVCKFLRRPKTQYKLRAHNISCRTPRIDVPTRWNSSSDMVNK